jgi:uncharacterized protein (TIGR00251 family)
MTMGREKEKDWTILPVIVHPKASEDRIAGFHGEALKVKVTAPPTGGKANQRLVEILADRLNIPKSRISRSSRATDRGRSCCGYGTSALKRYDISWGSPHDSCAPPI